MGGGNNAGMRVADGPLLLPAQLRRLGRRRRARPARRASPTRIPRPPSSGRGSCNTDGTLQRSVRGEPTLWRLATEYLFIRKLAPRSRLLNPLYAGGFDHDEVREVGLALRPGAARAARGGRRGRAVRRGLLHVQRGGRLADALPPGRLEGAVLPGRRGRARRRRLARRPAVRREPARPPALSQAPRAAAGRAGAAAAARVAPPAALLCRCGASEIPRGRPLPLVRRRPDAARE